MTIENQPTRTSYISIDADINDFGLGFQFTMKSDLFPFNSLILHFLFITIFLEWDIDLIEIKHDGGDNDVN